MARKVKCQVTNEWGTSDSFYKAPNGKYYKDELTYHTWQKKSELRSQCIKAMCDVADYKIAPSFLNKMIGEIGNAVGYDVLYETIQRDMDSFTWANKHKEFTSEIGKLFYYQSIIKNTVIDVYKEFQETKEKLQENNVTPPEDYAAGKIAVNGEDKISDLLGEI